jgi:hypothetical protein
MQLVEHSNFTWRSILLCSFQWWKKMSWQKDGTLIKCNSYISFRLNVKLWCRVKRASGKLVMQFLFYKVKRKTNKVDRAKRMHYVRSERAIAVTLIVRRLWQQSACAQPSLQAGYRISAGCVRLTLSTLFVFLFTFFFSCRLQAHEIEA